MQASASSHVASSLGALVFALALALGTTGCGIGRFGGRPLLHGSDAEVGGALAAGLIVGTAFAVANPLDQPPPKPEYYERNPWPYVPPPLPRKEPPPESDLPSFDPQIGRAALNATDLSSCAPLLAGSTGYGHARVTMNPDGRVSKVVVDEPVSLSPEGARCVGERLGHTTVPPFRGSFITMGTTFRLP